MMAVITYMSLLFFIYLNIYECSSTSKDVIRKDNFIYWPNATIPFYIEPNHFDKEQSLAILTTLAMFSFKTCLEFKPVLVAPKAGMHVMVFENELAFRRCIINREGHSRNDPHKITVGFECLKSPHIELSVMKALGFPFENNRFNRDLYIDVQFENIEQGSIDLFTKENILPAELRALPYDIDSVMHLGDRDYSKNGHRTIIFKDPKKKQNRIGLSPIDLQKIDIIYGAECKQRERQAKIEICKTYPYQKRVKRNVEVADTTETTAQNLRINRDITPPGNITNVTDPPVNDWGIKAELQSLVESIHKISATALTKLRNTHCLKTNDTKPEIKTHPVENISIEKIFEHIFNYIQGNVNTAIANLTVFCDSEIKDVQRCGANQWCPRSTKIGPVQYTTQHRPVYAQPTWHEGAGNRPYRSKREVVISNDAADKNETNSTTKRPDLVVDKSTPKLKGDEKSEKSKTGQISRRFGSYSQHSKEDKSMSSNEEDPQNQKYNEKLTQKLLLASYFNKKKDRIKNQRDVKHRDISDSEKRIQKKRERKISTERSAYTQREQNNERFGEEKDMQPEKKDVEDKTETDVEREETKTTKNMRFDKIKSKESEPEDLEGNIQDSNAPQETETIKENTIQLPRTVTLSDSNKEFYEDRIWPGGVVPYVLKEYPQYDMQAVRARLQEVNEMLDKYTCVQLQEVTEKDAPPDYIVLDTSVDFVTGRVGGRQQFGVLELFEGGQHRQHAAMIVMSMLGFYFELTRYDRDEHVRVHVRHIRPDKLHHFEKLRTDALLPLPYDYKSASHPAWQFWRRIGKTGISTVATYKDKDPDGKIMKSLGQNTRLLSRLDIIKINSVYGTDCFSTGQSGENK